MSAGQFVVAGDLLPVSVTIVAPSPPDGCALLVQSLRVWLPDQPADNPDACDAPGGISVPLNGNVLLAPGEFIRIACVDTDTPNCINPGDVNCEMLADEMCYIVNPEDAAGGGLTASACWSGVSLGSGSSIQSALDDTATLINPQISIECTPEAPDACTGHPAVVTFNYLVTTEGDVSIKDVQLVDRACGPAVRGADCPGNNNDLLEVGEVWTFSCTATLDIPLASVATVTGTDVMAGHDVSDNAVVVVAADCISDLDCDGDVDQADLAQVLIHWGACPAAGFCIDALSWPLQDGVVGAAELAALLASWDSCTPNG